MLETSTVSGDIRFFRTIEMNGLTPSLCTRLAACQFCDAEVFFDGPS